MMRGESSGRGGEANEFGGGTVSFERYDEW